MLDGTNFDQTKRFGEHNGHSHWISFEPPGPRIQYEKRYIFYRLRFDGVEASTNSLKCNTFDVVTLEVINCHERDRENGLMTINGLLLSKEFQERVHYHIDEYIKEVTATGIKGVFIKSKLDARWYYYRWGIVMDICDTVAQEELIGRPGAKNSSYPCIYSKDCKACRYNAETYSFTELGAVSPLTGKRGFKVIGLFLDQLHPNSFYRCLGFVFHTSENLDLITSYANQHSYEVTDIQWNEIYSINLVFGRFAFFLHQWRPTCISYAERYCIRVRECTRLFLKDKETETSEDQGFSEDDEEEVEEDVEEDVEEVENEYEEEGCFGDSHCEKEPLSLPGYTDEGEDEQDELDRDYDEDMPDDTPTLNSRDATASPSDISFRKGPRPLNLEDSSELNSLDPRTKRDLDRFIALLDKRTASSTDLTRNMLPEESDRHGVDAQHNMANIMLWLIRIFSGLVPTKTSKENNLFMDSWTKYMIYGKKLSESLSYTIYPNFSSIREKAVNRLKEFCSYDDRPPGISWLKANILELKMFKKISNHDKILFFFSMFTYVFQDSLYIPIMFFIKNIIDHLSYFYTAIGSIDEFAKAQANFNVFCGLLEGEWGIGFSNYSLHNAMHYYQTYVCGGSICLNACFVSERSYSLPKQSVAKGAKPELTAGKKVISFQTANRVELSFAEHPQSPSLKKPISTQNGIESLLETYIELFYLFSIVNILDDINHEKNSMMPQNALIDQVLLNGFFLGHQNLLELLNNYSRDNEFFLNSVDVEKGDGVKIYRKCTGIGAIGTPKAGSVHCREIAFTRLFNGKIQLFVVLGFVSVTMNNKSYVQALCLPIKTMSGSSWVHTLHYGFFYTNELTKCFDGLPIVPISICRLNFNRCYFVKYNEELTYFMIFKLAPCQWRIVDYDFLYDFKNTRKRKRID